MKAPTRYKNLLSFGNSKINAQAEMYNYRGGGASFDIPAGYTCPAANICLSWAVKGKNGKMHLEVSENTQFSCYAAKIEILYKGVFEKHHRNWEFTKQPEFIEVLKQQIWYSGVSLVRFHSFGDFYDFEYFQKCYEIAKSLPDVYFFFYTKQATFLKWYLENKLPNMDGIYSMGGLHDKYALKHNLPSCTVITDKKYKFAAETDEGLPIACRKDNRYDDLEFIRNQQSFGIFVH